MFLNCNVARSPARTVDIMRTLVALGVLALPMPVLAEETCENPGSCREIEEVTISAHPLSAEGIAQPASVLEGEALAQSIAPNLGDTVSRLPGIHSASFGPAVGRPVVHGQGGPRVRVMEDRIDTMDASVSSGDHATTIEPFIADRVEVLKGASTLLYGSGAIGGVVDVHTGRIPHERAEKAAAGRLLLRNQSNGQGTTAAARLDGGAGSFAWHLDGFTRDLDAYDIPGFAESAQLRAAEEAEGDGDEEGEEEVSGIAPGTDLEASGAAFGASWVGDGAFFGAAVSRYETTYGLPGGHEHAHEEGEDEEEEEEGNAILDMAQTRIDLEAGFEAPFAAAESLNVRLGFNDYEHFEIEPNGEVGTRFGNDAWEARAELVHAPLGGWRGVLGLQTSDREFSVVGEEAFVPPVDTATFGVFWVGERSFGNSDVETGLRLERVEHKPSVGESRDFSIFAASVGVVHEFSDALRLRGILDLSSRAPASEELYSDGPHLATQTFDVGNADLDREQAVNLAITLDYDAGRFGYEATVYHTHFSDFIYQAFTDEEEDGLVVAPYTQNDARFTGLDVSAFVALGTGGGASWRLDGLFDIVDATVSAPDTTFLPNISPARIGLGLSADWARLSASVDLLRVAEVDDVPTNQLPTDAYNDLRVDLGWRQPLARGELNLFLRGRNLTDDEQRNHTSLVKDFIPLPGRNIEVGARLTF